MRAIIGSPISRRVETLVLAVTALAVIVAVVVPALYAVALIGVCSAMALIAPDGRRGVAVMAGWLPVSVAVLVGTTFVG